MSTVAEIVGKIGRQRLMALLGVKKSAVSNACVEGVFPARWYVAVSGQCAELGIVCPRHLFNFIDPTATLSEEDAA